MASILFFLPDLNAGGAQRTVVNVLNHLNRKAFKGILVVGSAGGSYSGLLGKHVKVIELRQRKVRGCILPLSRQISALNPEILFAAYPDGNIALMIARCLSRSNSPVVLRESNHRTAQQVEWSWLMQGLVRWSYSKANRVVALSEGVRWDVVKRYGLPQTKVVTIHNPVDTRLIRHMARQNRIGWGAHEDAPGHRVFKLLGVGRLVRQKGFDLLVRAVGKLKDEKIHLTILGEGSERRNLLNLAAKLKIGERVFMPGIQRNPYIWMRNADLFVLPSRWEGFGHVIVEAMACGTPVLATRCLCGPAEIIRDGIDGMLCEPESVEDLAKGIRFMVDNPKERKRLSEAGRNAAERFDVEVMVRQYENVFRSVLEGQTY